MIAKANQTGFEEDCRQRSFKIDQLQSSNQTLLDSTQQTPVEGANRIEHCADSPGKVVRTRVQRKDVNSASQVR